MPTVQQVLQPADNLLLRIQVRVSCWKQVVKSVPWAGLDSVAASKHL